MSEAISLLQQVLVVLVACTVFVMRPGGRAMAAG